MEKLEKLWTNHYSVFVIVPYWFFGLCNNFAYVIMLSAAKDILTKESSKNETEILTESTTIATRLSSCSADQVNKYDCNELSTGAVLLADIIPGLIIKTVAPFFAHKLQYWQRVLLVVLINASSYLLVALSSNIYLIFLGVMCASLSAGFGEVTYLSLSTLYNRSLSITGWGSGTGAAGLFGALGYAFLTSIGLTPKNTILIMLFIPALMATFYIILPSIEFAKQRNALQERIECEKSSKNDLELRTKNDLIVDEEATKIEEKLVEVKSSGFWFIVKKILLKLKSIMKYMIPLFLVYFAQYFINHGLFELLYFRESSISHKEQYRWYSVAYQAGVFVSRSSIYCIKIKFIPIFPILQWINVAICLFQIYFDFIPVIWIMFAIIFWEGLVAGGCYVNAFNLASIEIPQDEKESSIGIISIANSLGVVLSGLICILYAFIFSALILLQIKHLNLIVKIKI